MNKKKGNLHGRDIVYQSNVLLILLKNQAQCDDKTGYCE